MSTSQPGKSKSSSKSRWRIYDATRRFPLCHYTEVTGEFAVKLIRNDTNDTVEVEEGAM